VELQDSVAVPDPVTMDGVIAPHVSPDGTVSVRVTVPVNPLIPVTVMVDIAVWPTSTAAGEVAAIVKSAAGFTVKVTVAECTSEPLVAVTVTAKVPVDVRVQESVEVPEPVMVVGDRVQAALFAARVAVPANPLIAVSVIVEVPAVFTVTVTLVGLAVMVKSWTMKVTVVVAELVPLVPVTVTV
jgi:hypothetical protein